MSTIVLSLVGYFSRKTKHGCIMVMTYDIINEEEESLQWELILLKVNQVNENSVDLTIVS